MHCAGFIGRDRVKVLPFPTSLSTDAVPLCIAAILLLYGVSLKSSHVQLLPHEQENSLYCNQP